MTKVPRLVGAVNVATPRPSTRVVTAVNSGVDTAPVSRRSSGVEGAAEESAADAWPGADVPAAAPLAAELDSMGAESAIMPLENAISAWGRGHQANRQACQQDISEPGTNSAEAGAYLQRR